ncbi:class I SAM-dependent methyltransferase [Amycolatopsis sp. CA-126428]|uniref:class I SAM-dependent methyltransferase n=1 Tax=Amycolatopsis sp. CA-126428 TaxID=2073158 RepID=UPI001E5945D1|nr:class I SAM-dependent methyltransferase [Amycolatopsis sp. CA-126428]
MRADWEELPGHFDDATFDVVFCVGNSLHHAVGARGRVAALASMSRLLRRGGRLVLTSRTWELVRARGSRLDIGDRLVRRNGRAAVVVYRWEIAPLWEEEHHPLRLPTPLHRAITHQADLAAGAASGVSGRIGL